MGEAHVPTISPSVIVDESSLAPPTPAVDERQTSQNGFVTIPPSTRSAAPLVALEAFEQT